MMADVFLEGSWLSFARAQVDDKIMDLSAFRNFLTENIKLNGRKGELGDTIKVTMDRTRVTVTSHVEMSKRYTLLPLWHLEAAP